MSRGAFVQFEEVHRFTFLNEIGGDATAESAIKSLAARNADLSLGRTQEYVSKLDGRAREVGPTVERLAPFEPAIDVPFDRGVDLAKATEVTRHAPRPRSRSALRRGRRDQKPNLGRPRAVPRGVDRVQSEAIVNYTDHFPSQGGMDLTTPARPAHGELADRRGGDTRADRPDRVVALPSRTEAPCHPISAAGRNEARAAHGAAPDHRGGSPPHAHLVVAPAEDHAANVHAHGQALFASATRRAASSGCAGCAGRRCADRA